MVSGCCCKGVYIDILTIIINFPYSILVTALFWQEHPYFFVHLKNVFVLIYVIFVQYSKRYLKNIRDHSKIEIMPT